MADVEMPDAGPSGAGKTKDPAAKSSKTGGEVATDGKKRFEVKKVCLWSERLRAGLTVYSGTL